MRVYAIQVLTGNEDDFIALSRGIGDIRVFCPKRILHERKGGKTRPVQHPLFSGYVFVQAVELTEDLAWQLRKTRGFCRFLRNNDSILPLNDHDADLLKHFMSFGEVADTSTVSFDENDRVKILSGPLLGFEAFVLKVDRRKRRIRVRLTLYDNAIPIDFSYVAVEKIVGKTAGEDESGDRAT